MAFPFCDVESDMDNLLDNDSVFGVAMHQGDDVCECTEQGNMPESAICSEPPCSTSMLSGQPILRQCLRHSEHAQR